MLTKIFFNVKYESTYHDMMIMMIHLLLLLLLLKINDNEHEIILMMIAVKYPTYLPPSLLSFIIVLNATAIATIMASVMLLLWPLLDYPL